MYKKKVVFCYQFTLVELLVVLFIIGILAGLVFPSFARVREKAKYTRWLTYNIGFNRDSDTVINFNFEAAPHTIIKNNLKTEVVNNLAVVCDAEKFDSIDYNGIMKNSVEWVKGGGRWPFKSAIQFDGRNDYIEIANSFVIDFDPSKEAFSIIIWLNFYANSNQYIFSKGTKTNKLQYGSYFIKKLVGATVGKSPQSWKTPVMETMRWYQVALVNKPGEGYNVYVNGKLTDKSTKKVRKVQSVKLTNAKLILGALLIPGKKKDKLRNRFRGRVDEFIVFKRALSEREVEQNYLMGNPY